MAEVRELPPGEQVGPRPTSKGAVDLTGGKLFLQNTTLHANLVRIVEQRAPNHSIWWEPTRKLKLHAIIRILLRSLHSLHNFWTQKELLSPAQLDLYAQAIASLHKAWLALGWKPTVWVHWVCAHSTFFLTTYRSLYSFSSIPTEHRHHTFKMDLRHAFEGWKFKSPLLTSRWLTRVVNLNALDQGLHLLSLANSVGTDAIFTNKKKKRKLAEVA